MRFSLFIFGILMVLMFISVWLFSCNLLVIVEESLLPFRSLYPLDF